MFIQLTSRINLYQTLTKSRYNQQVGENSTLREEIETLRIKHRNFQNEEKRLSKIEKNLKAEINEVIEASQDAHEQREDAKNKTIMLRSRAEKDLSQVLQ